MSFRWTLALVTFFALVSPHESFAVLSDDQASIATVADALSASHHDVEVRGQLTIHVLRTSEIEVREIVAGATGQVVAVIWNGSREPRRIATLLGPLMPEYVHAIRLSQERGRSPGAAGQKTAVPRVRGPAVLTRTDHLVIELFSRMGVSHGRVYLADLPSGVSPSDLH